MKRDTTTGARITNAGHDPEALSIITAALAEDFPDPLDAFAAAVRVFCMLHDTGIRMVPRP